MPLIRKLEKSDAKHVVFLIRQLTKNIVAPKNFLQRIEGLAEPGNWQYFVAEKDDKVVGFAGIAWYPIPSKGMVGWIEEVVVDENFRGQGLAHKLMEELLYVALFRDLAQVKLTTGNDIAQHIYEEFGFSVKEEHLMVKKYY